MNNIKEAYQFSLRVEEKLNKKYDYKNSGRVHGGRSSRRSYRGQNYDQKNKDDAISSSQNQRGDNSNNFHDLNNRDQTRKGRGRGSGRGGFHGIFSLWRRRA